MKITRIIVIVGLFLLLATLNVSAQDEENACYAKDGLWDATTRKCTIKSGFEIDINYPLSMTQYPFAEQTIDSFISDYKTQFAQSYTPIDNAGPNANLWSLTMDYQEFQHGQNIVSVLFLIGVYTGGAHPNVDLRSFTFDVAQDKEITLNDLFVQGSNPWPTIAQIVQQSLEAQLSTEIGAPLQDADKQLIQSGAGENPDNYQSFVLDGDSLVLYFPPYQVAAYAAGMQSVTIPLSSLSGLIDTSVIGA